jgi:nucleoside-diphosphate-sugar epimerase
MYHTRAALVPLLERLLGRALPPEFDCLKRAPKRCCRFRATPSFVVQALKREPITVYGAGAQTRSFRYVDDLIEALIRLMNTPDDFTGPVNFGNTNGFTILELAQRVVALAGSALKTPHRDGTTTSPKANLTRFHGVFAPPHALRGSIVLSI